METIQGEVEIHANPRKIYQAITTPEGRRSRSTDHCEVGVHIGNLIILGFTKKIAAWIEVQFRIDQLNLHITVEWVCISTVHAEAWQNTQVVFQ